MLPTAHDPRCRTLHYVACRATTCYLVQRRIDMLPKPLTEDICSLRSNVERLAFSAIWEMTQDAQVLHVRFGSRRRVLPFITNDMHSA